MKQMLRRFRYWLILRLAGKDTVVINAKIGGTLSFDTRENGAVSYGLIVNTTIGPAAGECPQDERTFTLSREVEAPRG